jgi:transposase
MLQVFAERGLLKGADHNGPTRPTSCSAVRANRLEMVERPASALNVLAQVAPDWLQTQVPEEWYERYGQRFDEHRLPRKETERLAFAETIGRDGVHLMRHIFAEEAPAF